MTTAAPLAMAEVGVLLTDFRAGDAPQVNRLALAAFEQYPIMRVAVTMYERVGVAFERHVPDVHGAPYGIYVR